MKHLLILIMFMALASCNNPKIPPDISLKINELFTNEHDNIRVHQKIKGLYKERLNVGHDQLARAILILSEGNKERFDELMANFMSDPRDVIMMAEDKLGNPGHFCIVTFDKMKLK